MRNSDVRHFSVEKTPCVLSSAS
ncbi:MAG: hypothetical protein DSY55_06845 [Clostridia bacterium]|nr:MAG: hypothetical protein DSY55_06845 [Clostridia bacterium]